MYSHSFQTSCYGFPVLFHCGKRKCLLLVQFIYDCTFGSGVHVQNMQVCYIGKHLPWCFAVLINPSSTLSISSNAIPPLAPTLWQAPVCDVPLSVSMCSHCSTSTYEREHAVLVFCSLSIFPHIIFIFLFIHFFETGSLSPRLECRGTSMAHAASTSWAQVILQPQPPE